MKPWMIVLLAALLLLLAAGAAALTAGALRRRSDRRIAAYQNKLLAQQIAEVENLYRTMRGWRHDYHNHLQTLKARLDMGQTAGAREYLSRKTSPCPTSTSASSWATSSTPPWSPARRWRRRAVSSGSTSAF